MQLRLDYYTLQVQNEERLQRMKICEKKDFNFNFLGAGIGINTTNTVNLNMRVD